MSFKGFFRSLFHIIALSASSLIIWGAVLIFLAVVWVVYRFVL